MFDALHALFVNALVVLLVFTAIAASRNDNDSAKKPGDRPTKRLFVFGVLFVLYLSFKSYELSIPYIWFWYKKTLDIVSLLLGLSCMVVLLTVTTYKFTYWVAIPEVFAVLGSFFLLGTRPLEFFHRTGLKLIRLSCYPYYYLTRCIALLTCNGQQANGNDEENPPANPPADGLNALLERWDQEILEAKDRATAARDAKAQAKADRAAARATRAAERRAAEAAGHANNQPGNDQPVNDQPVNDQPIGEFIPAVINAIPG